MWVAERAFSQPAKRLIPPSPSERGSLNGLLFSLRRAILNGLVQQFLHLPRSLFCDLRLLFAELTLLFAQLPLLLTQFTLQLAQFGLLLAGMRLNLADLALQFPNLRLQIADLLHRRA